MSSKLFFLILFVVFISCKTEEKKHVILSKSFENYVNWIYNDKLIIIDAYSCENLDSVLLLVDGIVLTGGEDINPLMYNDSSNLILCEKMDFIRDTIEKKLFDYSLNNNIPFIGVCRGMQMMNVAHGGTLYGDIPSEIGEDVTHRNNGEVMHDIVLSSTNQLYTNMIFPQNPQTSFIDTVFNVNSWHHQGLKKIAPGIKVIAKSHDGLPEAVVMDINIHSFMIAVQFHPERLGKDNLIHRHIRSNFLHAISN